MKNKLIVILISLIPNFIFAQTQSELGSVLIDAEVQSSPPQIKLEWTYPHDASKFIIYRKLKRETSWGIPVATLINNINEYSDNTVSTGISYEYKIHGDRSGSTDGYGYINTGIEIPVVEHRGRIALVIDTTYYQNLQADIYQLKLDLVGDGWTVGEIKIDRDDSPQIVKTAIRNLNNNIGSLKAVLLLGHVPVPYSGDYAIDGHNSDHRGAWPTDGYYGDLTGNWTDVSVNRTVGPERIHNIPGDGKFDQNTFPAYLQIQVGRVDLSDLPAFTDNEETLLRQYLQKAHAFKHGEITIVEKGIIDDKLPTLSEGFASTGLRNFAPLVGKENVEQGSYFSSLNNSNYLWSYAGGYSSYTSMGRVGATSDFASNVNNLKGIFTMLFGSYFVDWDNTNNFLRAPLASGDILTSCWVGRPHWYFHHMGLGENIGYSTLVTQNNTGVTYDIASPFTARFNHLALMGDPTLRQRYFKPPTNLSLAYQNDTLNLQWTASTDNGVLGYHVYYSEEEMGHYVKISDTLITGTSFNHLCSEDGYYMVRALELRESSSGTYYNLSQGIIRDIEIGTTSETCTCPTDKDALVALYNSTNGTNWTNKWDLTQPINTWYGVGTNNSGCVTSLELSNNQLTGNTPIEIGHLDSLEILNLSNNQLEGKVYSIINNLDNLKVLNLSNNQLTGGIPAIIGDLTDLKTLKLNNNQLTGAIPTTIGSLINLDTIFLQNNQLGDCFPISLLPFCNIVYDFSQNTGLPGGGDFATYCIERTGDCREKLCTYSDSLILVTLYQTTNGINWTNKWDLNESMHLWYGVVTNEEGCVSELNLSSNNLAGNIPPEIGSLSNLTRLNLGGNTLTGNIPSELSNLENLVTLFLFENQLTGSIPTLLSNLSNLESLMLNDNILTGNIPSQIGNLVKLRNLHLDKNELNGVVQPEIGNLEVLETLFLNDNQLEGNIPREIGNLLKLTQLYLTDNQLSGDIPLEIGDLLNLTHLYLNNNQLSGCFSQVLNKFCIIDYDFSGNPNLPDGGNFANFCQNGVGYCIEETCRYQDSLVLVALYQATDGANWTNEWDLNQPMHTWYGISINEEGCVKELNLTNNNLVGNIPVELGGLDSLKTLFLNDNQLSGCFPHGLNKFCTISYDFSENANLPGGGNFVDFCQNGIGDCIKETCGYQDSIALVALYQATNGANWTNKWDLSQPINTWYGVVTNDEGCVINLSLVSNKLAGTIPSQIGDFDYLSSLNLRDNQLIDGIPLEIGNLDKLSDLYFGYNQLTDSIPSEIGNLNSLINLDLEHNQLTGVIPPEIGNINNLLNVYLSGNRLTGVIPLEIGNLVNLNSLYLGFNQLTGVIPPEIGSLHNLSNLYLRNNQLTGAIPPEMGNLVNSFYLDLRDNQLNGCFPQELNRFCDIKSNFSGNPNLPGGGDFAAFCSDETGICSAIICLPSITFVSANVISSGIHQSNTTITASANLSAGADVIFKAGESITLLPNFTVTAGTKFSAIIEDCPDNDLVDKNNSNTNSLSNLLTPSLRTRSLNLGIQPNPLKHQAIITYDLPIDGKVQLSLSNLQGKQFQVLLNGVYQEAGSHQYEFFAGNLPKGLFFLSLRTKEGVITKRLVVVD